MGAERIQSAFQDARDSGWASALIPFVCAGDPDLATTERCLTSFGVAGASIVEVGIPFSDPIADGPTIASAMHRVLTAGLRIHDVLGCIGRARAAVETPFVAMVSCSIARRFGPAQFAAMLADAGFDGVIYPDVPVEEADEFAGPANDAGLAAPLLVSPTTSPERAERIARASTGFIYAMARTGITGGTGRTDKRAADFDRASYLSGLRSLSETPVACGFGISTPDDVRKVAREADGVIVGSAIVKAMDAAHGAGKDAAESATALVAELADAAHVA